MDVAPVGRRRDDQRRHHAQQAAEHPRHAVQVVDPAGVLQVDGLGEQRLQAREAGGGDGAGQQADAEGRTAIVGGGGMDVGLVGMRFRRCTRSAPKAHAPGVDHEVARGADGDAARQRGVLHVHHGEVAAQALGAEEGGDTAPCVSSLLCGVGFRSGRRCLFAFKFAPHCMHIRTRQRKHRVDQRTLLLVGRRVEEAPVCG